MKQTKWIAAVLAVIMIWSLSACASLGEKPKLTVYLHNESLLAKYAPKLQEQVPEAELEFVVGRDSLDFYLFRQEHGELPDIITVGSSMLLQGGEQLTPFLMDLSGTETAASFYDIYLENYRESNGAVHWLPAGGNSNGILANLDLFEQYDIPLPTDYASFAAACQAFRAQGIQPYTSDFKYNYTCLYTLEGWSIPALMSRQGTQWRRDYEHGKTDRLDEEVWLGAFHRLAQVFEDTGLGPDAVGRGYTMTLNDFYSGSVPMIRGMDNEISLYAEQFNCVLLPYFGEDGNWLLTTPRFHVALNASLEEKGNESKKELALRVLAGMFSNEGYQAMLSDTYIYMLPYNRGVDVVLPASMRNLQPLIDSNHLFLLLSSDSMQDAAKEAVHGLLRGELDPRGAYERMNEALSDPVIDRTVVATLEKGWPVSFQPGRGSQAASAIANTLRELAGSQLLLAPSSICSGSLYAGDYTAQRLDESVKSSGNHLYTAKLSGAEVWELIRLAVEGFGSVNDPFSWQTLPVVSGCAVKVEQTQGGYRLAEITVDGAPLAEEAEYLFTVADLPPQFQALVASALGDEGQARFTASETYARTLWTEYLMDGAQPLEPTDYITVSQAGTERRG